MSSGNKIMEIVHMIASCLIVVLIWVLVYIKRKATSSEEDSHKSDVVDYDHDLQPINQMKIFLQCTIVLGETLLLGTWLLMRVAVGQCSDYYSFNNFRCNPSQDSGTLPIDSVVAIMLVPLATSIVFRGIPFPVQLFSWAMTVAFIVCSAAFVRLDQSAVSLCIFVPTALFMLYEGERQNRMMFHLTDRMAFVLQENERLADETHANELRHMLGNVAHDLKTPLTAFITCMDMMGTTLDGFEVNSEKGIMTATEVQSNVTQLCDLLEIQITLQDISELRFEGGIIDADIQSNRYTVGHLQSQSMSPSRPQSPNDTFSGDVVGDLSEFNREKSVRAKTSDMVIQRIPGGVIFLSRVLKEKPVLKSFMSTRQDRKIAAADSLLIPIEKLSINSPIQSAIRNAAQAASQLRILLVDDTMTVLKMVSMVLRKQGHIVETAQHGAEALDKLELRIREGEQERQQASTLHITPSAAAGLDVEPSSQHTVAYNKVVDLEKELKSDSTSFYFSHSKKLKHIRKQAHQCIVAMSANGDPATSAQAFAAGADKFICKPFAIDQLNAVIEELLEAGKL
eukprot:gene14000-16096_t